ncbi:hypothetical protein M408DRAFT_333110 [Serendipita vermifera MAFF 305830]|uniref:Uncharacterized protein n=1 Tax=Serendipita vermifera MAFF 305830 TaxID=933852 RepID=A0A0C2WRK4_SERVB|nr:hypothetical protein M408DRAFT_334079 [Serendipita vermifera MAFF 305830]KIM21981.1 hypothetical protein M408DRAFT_333110 [Serendipita vermifera MAFF 305830]
MVWTLQVLDRVGQTKAQAKAQRASTSAIGNIIIGNTNVHRLCLIVFPSETPASCTV